MNVIYSLIGVSFRLVATNAIVVHFYSAQLSTHTLAKRRYWCKAYIWRRANVSTTSWPERLNQRSRRTVGHYRWFADVSQKIRPRTLVSETCLQPSWAFKNPPRRWASRGLYLGPACRTELTPLQFPAQRRKATLRWQIPGKVDLTRVLSSIDRNDLIWEGSGGTGFFSNDCW